MRIRLLTALMALALVVSACAAGGDAGALGDGRAPDFTLELADGGTFDLAGADRPVYLVFWAEW